LHLLWTETHAAQPLFASNAIWPSPLFQQTKWFYDNASLLGDLAHEPSQETMTSFRLSALIAKIALFDNKILK
jgi:hypothetical protein